MSNILIVVSVDWEGRSLLSQNLEVMASFRRKYPDIPFQHFLNAAYYTRAVVDVAKTTAAIRSTLLPEDEHGLHIHAWHSLLSAAGVAARHAPRFLPEDLDLSAVKAPDDWGFYPEESGYDVPLEHFEVDEVDRMIQTSQAILTAQGFRLATTFRAGGWMSGRNVQEALARNMISLDCSAVDPQVPFRRFGDIPLYRWVTELWPGINDCSQPHRVVTRAGDIWEIPNNAGLVDYTSTKEVVAIFQKNVAFWRESPNRHCVISTGFHQETARKFLDRLDGAIEIVRGIADEERLPLVFTARPQDFLH
jgi:hypothetical protein